MPMPDFESRSVGLPEVTTPEPMFLRAGGRYAGALNPAEAFMSSYIAMSNVNAKRRQLEEQLTKMALQNEYQNRMADIRESAVGVQQQRMENAYQTSLTKLDIDRMNAENRATRIDDLRRTGEATASLRDAQAGLALEKTKAMAEAATTQLQKTNEALRRARLENFHRTYGTMPGGLGLPADAFENDKIPGKDVSTDAPGWHLDPNKPNQRYYNKPLLDKDGNVIKDENGNPRMHPITVDNSTFKSAKQMYDDLKSNGPTSIQATPNDLPSATAPQSPTWKRDPITGKLTQQPIQQ